MKFLESRWATVALVGLVALFSIHLVDRWLSEARVDLTADDLYSLTEGSERILERMNDEGVPPVDVTLYFSETLGKTLPKFVKDFISYDRYLRSLLGEYERASGGRVRVSLVDPLPDTDEAQEAADAGLEGKLINQEGDQFYFGMTFETQTGSNEVIGFLWPNEQENVEYEITKTLSRLVWPERKRVGVLSSLEVFGSADDPFMAQMMAAQGRQPTPKWISIQLLEELYDTTKIDADTDSISNDDLDLLVVIHPKNLPRKTLFAIDQFVARGGRAMIFVDPYTIEDRAPQNPQQPWAAMQYKPSSNLEPLLANWGIIRPEDRFAADIDLAVRRPMGNGAAESLLVDLAIAPDDFEQTVDREQPIFQGLSDLRFLLAGTLGRVEELSSAASENPDSSDGDEGGSVSASDDASTGVQITPLITTTAAGSAITVMPGFGGEGQLAYTDFNAPGKLRDAFTPGTEPQVLAYLLRGKLGTAYPDGVEYPDQEPERPPGLPPGIELPPPEGAEMIRREPLPTESLAESAVMVFADVDFISDQLAFSQGFGLVQAANDNHRVMLNGVEFLLGSEELMSVRAKGTVRRPFVLFDDIEAQAEKDTLEREREIRAEIESFEQELRDKQSAITARNASLFQKNLQDEVELLNERILEGNRELREIRKERRQKLEAQESFVRFSVLGWMPILVLGAGFWQLVRRGRERSAAGATSSQAVDASPASEES